MSTGPGARETQRIKTFVISAFNIPPEHAETLAAPSSSVHFLQTGESCFPPTSFENSLKWE